MRAIIDFCIELVERGILAVLLILVGYLVAGWIEVCVP